MHNIIHPKHSSEEFNKKIIELINLVSNGAVHLFPQNEEDLKNRIIMHNFINKVHQNWKVAQNIICGEILNMYDEIDEISKKIKQRNISTLKNKNINVKLLRENENILKIRIKKLRCIFNTIIWLMIGNNDYMPKRFYRGTSDNINRKTLSEIFLVADRINADVNKIAILNDLSTFMQVADLTVLDENGLSFAEVKLGSKNDDLLNLYQKALNGIKTEKVMQLNTKDMQHFNRIERQANTMKKVREFITNDEGEHLQFGLPGKHTESQIEVEKYHMVINNIYDELTNKNYALTEIDDCVFIGLYKREIITEGKNAMNAWMDEINAEGQLFCFNTIMLDPLATPVLSIGLSDKLTKDIMCDKVILYIYLDIIRFIKKFQSNNINVRLLSKKESGRVLASKIGKSLYTYNGQLIAHNNGYYGNGFISRIVSSLEKPSSVIQVMTACVPQ